ncbi:MAG: hypothetical protein KDD19_02775 [Phaeodactylibacter sp.]|nr:hypothetical protein [Phaeodactylibacter sp.]MCB9050632.1 hypothetical protein [Lewinellaceae bacterium]
MKQIFLGILLLSLWSCTGDGKSPGEQQAGSQASGTEQSAGTNVPSTGDSGSFLPAQVPAGHPMVPILTTDYWIFEFYVIDDAAARAANKGRWFRFLNDGTYESGSWEEKTGYGSWRLQDEEGKVMLYLDNVVDSEDGQWEIQGVNKEQDTMTWSGINKTNTAGVITKVINLLTRPTKAQFGVE